MFKPISISKNITAIKKGRLILFATSLFAVSASQALETTPIYSSLDRFHPVFAAQGMVASQEALATNIGVDILARGGNAVDAAVAVGFALAVTLPRAGNLGGGGFMIIHLADKKQTLAIDYREKSPAESTADMYLDENGEVNNKLSRFHPLAVGVPGTVAGMVLALEEYGTLSLKEVLEPAIELAAQGIVMTPDLSDSLKNLEKRLKAWPSTKKIFYKDSGDFFQPGDTFVQEDLANSLRLIAQQGEDAFYSGEIAEQIVEQVQNDGGLLSMKDMADYQAVIREPVKGMYRGYEIASMPPPSSGGTHIVQILNILENFPMGFTGHNSSQSLHLMAEAMKLAYADRSEYLGDSDFVEVPIKGLTSKAYAKALSEKIDLYQAASAQDIKPGEPIPYESNETTHYSVVDSAGNAVSNTYTINFSYGTGLVAEGTGILLNNEMDDFSAKPGVPNAYGLIGGEANAIEPGKRPLSSMSPTIVLKDGKPILVTGSPGGSRIITTTLQVIMNVIDHGMNIAEATNAARMHHQWLPDEIRVEKGLSKDTIEALVEKGHKIKVKNAMGSTQSIMLTDEGYKLGASDPRRSGALTAGH